MLIKYICVRFLMKFALILVFALSAILFTMMYTTSMAFSADNEYVMSCSYTKDKKTAFCSDNDPTNNDVWRCDKQKNGTWKCGKTVSQMSNGLPTDLKKGLDLATGNSLTVKTSNDTSPFKDFMSKKNELSKGNAEISPDEGNSSSPSVQ